MREIAGARFNLLLFKIYSMTKPSCFISYSWETDDHKDWVRGLASELQRNGVVTLLDQWDAHPGIDLPSYMETSIRDSDFVLLICTPIFAQKANSGKGGVGYEKSIVTGEIFANTPSPTKFVPLLRRGTQSESLPSYLKARVYIDFRDENAFDSSLEDLLRHIFQSRKYQRPPLGTKPNFSLAKSDPPPPIVKQQNNSFPLAAFEHVYRFAQSPEGMGMSKFAAEQFATRWISRFHDKNFEQFTKVYQFARSQDGMGKSKFAAEEFAIHWMERFYNTDFEELKRAYMFALSPEGMGKSKFAAENFVIEALLDKQKSTGTP